MLAFLPPHCDRPIKLGEPPPARSCGLAQAAREHLFHTLELLDSQAIGAAPLHERLVALERLLSPLEATFSHDPERRHLGQTVVWQRHVWSDTDESESPELLERYRIYDAHFGIMRMDRMDWRELAHQTVSTLRRTAYDLCFTLLSREQYRILLVAAFTMLERMFPPAHAETATVADSPEEIEPVAGRWRNGHHLFGLCCYFGRESLHCALDAAEADQPQECCRQIYESAKFMSATSATLGYTSDFPASNYVDQIRSAMPPGFSGSHNSDFNHFKLLKGKLQVALIRRWGNQPLQWPEEVLAAARHFRSIDLLDLEHHILVAASRVGLGASLKQTVGASDYGSAVEALRSMAYARQHDFKLG